MSKAAPREAPFAQWMGLQSLSINADKMELVLDQRVELQNRQGTLHGGVIATLLDTAMVRAARAKPGVEGIAGTIDLHIQYLMPASGRITAVGRVEHISKTMAFCRAEATNVDGNTVALASATIKLILVS